MSTPVAPQTAVECRAEWAACAQDPLYFLDNYCYVYDATARKWLPFRLWDAQVEALGLMEAAQLVVILKARQLGLTWLVLGLILWLMLFWPACTALLFSKREEEAIYLLGEERLRGMYRRLPPWMRVKTVKPDGATAWTLANGSVARAFPSNAGDSYTATVALVDEADLLPDLDNLLGRVKPTIDAGGKLILLSRADKSKPESAFKRVYRAAKAGGSPWRHLFIPWQARPGRDAAWYAAQRKDTLDRTGSLDNLHEQYPATDAEALSPRTLDKRIAPAWLQQCYTETVVLEPEPRWERPAPALPGLKVYKKPLPGGWYVVGADPAEGNPLSDDSALEVLDAQTGEQVACLAERLQPAVFAAAVDLVGRWYNDAAVLVERNNHGHAVLLWLAEHSKLEVLAGHDGGAGWSTNSLSKALLYDAAADAFRESETLLHNFATFVQLSSVEGATLRAPSGQMDDKAVAYALALVAARKKRREMAAGVGVPYVIQ